MLTEDVTRNLRDKTLQRVPYIDRRWNVSSVYLSPFTRDKTRPDFSSCVA